MWSVKHAMACAAAGFVMTAATAQAETLEVKVPFAFTVEGQAMPAGKYRLERNDTAASVILIRGEEGARRQLFVLTTPAGGRNPAGDDAALVFAPYENSYQLVGIWESRGEGHEVPADGEASARLAQTLVFAHRVS